jgi:hypothetical protein
MAITKRGAAKPSAETTFIAGAGDAKPARFIRGKKAQITLSISPELLDQVDEIARRKHLSRAALVTVWLGDCVAKEAA